MAVRRQECSTLEEVDSGWGGWQGPTVKAVMETPCSEITDSCSYNEHHKCSGQMHEWEKFEHCCACTCHIPKI